MDGDKQSNRSHRPSKTGSKAEKKGTAKAKPDRGQNPKVSPATPVPAIVDERNMRSTFFSFSALVALCGTKLAEGRAGALRGML